MGSVHVRHMPCFVSVEPSAVCQLRCPECPVGMANGEGRKAKGERMMSPEVWQRVLREVSPYVHTIQFYFQGEPLLNPHLIDMIRDAHAQGIYTIVSTNAQALTREMASALVESGLDRIIISMDGLTEASYGAYRVGGSLEQTKAALRYLREAKKQSPIIELQCLRLRTNEHEWAEMRRQYRRLGADRLTLKTAQLYDYEQGHPLMPSDLRYARYEQTADGTYRLRRRRRIGCLRLWSGVVITTTGEVLPCCYDKSGDYAYGNIMRESLRSLFHNEKAQRFRRQALRYEYPICQNCWQ